MALAPLDAPSLHRVSLDDIPVDSVIAACRELPRPNVQAAPLDESLIRRLLTTLTSSSRGVQLLTDGTRLVLVATVVDRIQNGRNAAHLAIIGCAEELPGPAFRALVLDQAAEFASQSGKRSVHLEWTPQVLDLDEALARGGFRHGFDMYTMRMPVDSRSPPPPADPLVWSPLDASRVAEVHDLLLAAFHDAAATLVPPLDEFSPAALAAPDRWHLLLEAGRVAGIARVAVHGSEGQVRTLARHPAQRGRGLGRLLLDRAVRQLTVRDGVESVTLEVEADNVRATALYTDYGFKLVNRVPWFERVLVPAEP